MKIFGVKISSHKKHDEFIIGAAYFYSQNKYQSNTDNARTMISIVFTFLISCRAIPQDIADMRKMAAA